MLPDEQDPPAPEAAGPSVDEQLATVNAHNAALAAENAELRAKLAVYEPAPPPIQEYPKWVEKRTADSVERMVVADEAAFRALGEGWV